MAVRKISALCIVNKCLLWSQGYAVVVWYCKIKMTGVGNVCGPMRHVAMCEFGRRVVMKVSKICDRRYNLN